MNECNDETSLETYQGWVNDTRLWLNGCKVRDRKLSRKDRTQLLRDIAMMHAGDTPHDHALLAMLLGNPNVSYEDVRTMRRLVMQDVTTLREGRGPKVIASLRYGWKLCMFLASCEAGLRCVGGSWPVKTDDILLYMALAAR